MRILDPRGSFTSRVMGLPTGVAVSLIGVAVVANLVAVPAYANGAKPLYTHSTTMTVAQTASGTNTIKSTRTASRSAPSDVYHVPTAYVDAKKRECRRTFARRKKWLVCEKAQDARGVVTEFGVTQFRSRYFGNLWHKYARLAARCLRHGRWCGHTPKFKGMTVGNCGGVLWAPPLRHFRYMCLRWRARHYHVKWENLVFFRHHTVPLATTDILRLASARIGPHARPGIYRSFHKTLFGGPYEAMTLNRSATDMAHSQVDLTDGAQSLATSLCATIGFVPQLRGLSIGCIAYINAVVTGVRNDINTAYNSGNCVQFRFYFLYPLQQLTPLGPLAAIRQAFDPTLVVNCPSSRTAMRRSQS